MLAFEIIGLPHIWGYLSQDIGWVIVRIRFPLLGLIILNKRIVHSIFLEPLRISLTIVAPNLEMCTSTFLIFEPPQDFAEGECEGQGSGQSADRPARVGGVLMEETVESSLEWGGKNCRLGGSWGS